MNEQDYGQYEILDRTSIIITQLDENILRHQSLTKKQAKKVAKAIGLLSDVYQLAGAECAK